MTNRSIQAETQTSSFGALPSVGSVLEAIKQDIGIRISGEALSVAVSDSLATIRRRIGSGEVMTREEIVQLVLAEISRLDRDRLQPVINATGVIIHTNLGRSMVSAETAAAMHRAGSSYLPLEIEPETNARGGRMSEISALLRLLCGAEAALVVNNNAAAVLVTLSAVAEGRDVILSRGEAVEIGGGFRIPDVMRQSGARLVEVGTTNRTYLRDYEQAVSDSTAALLKVHLSNFEISGFVHTATVEELARLGSSRHIPVIQDLGSGAFIDTAQFGLKREPTMRESLAAGASIVTASGDKLLGGPQAGLIAGGREWIARIERHPLARAVRADKTCIAGIAATLRHYANGDAIEKIPVWRLIASSAEALSARADVLSHRLNNRGVEVGVKPARATIGGGSLPGQELPSFALTFSVANADELAKSLRTGEPSIFGRVERQELLLDLRSVLPEQDEDLFDGICQALDRAT